MQRYIFFSVLCITWYFFSKKIKNTGIVVFQIEIYAVPLCV
jgi:hypothetical protein